MSTGGGATGEQRLASFALSIASKSNENNDLRARSTLLAAADGQGRNVRSARTRTFRGLVLATALIGRKSAPMLAIGPMLGGFGQCAVDPGAERENPAGAGLGPGLLRLVF